ncbi:MAG: hypothetical protein ACI9D5_001168 [Candidatus Endobugula sp.]|jgi:hypothetical protein
MVVAHYLTIYWEFVLNDLIGSIKKYKVLYVLLTFIVLYSPFFGYSYVKGVLAGAGFSNPYVSISVQESIFQAGLAIQSVMLKITGLNFFDLIFERSLDVSLAVTGVIIVMAAIFRLIKFFSLKSLSSKAMSVNESFDAIYTWFSKNPFTFMKTVVLAVVGFFIAFLSQYIIVFLSTIGLLLVWLTMMWGNVLGYSVGKSYVNVDICRPYTFKVGQQKQVGCSQFTLVDGTVLKGGRIYKTNNISYFVTNEGAYEIDSKQRVIYFSPIFRNKAADKINGVESKNKKESGDS